MATGASPIYEHEEASPSQVRLLSTPIDSPDATGSTKPLLVNPQLSSEAASPTGGAGGKDFDENGDTESLLHEPTAGFGSCSINLLKTIIGAGMLAMPSAFAALGYIPGTLFVLVAATLAAFGLHLLIVSGQYVGGRNITINKLASVTYPQLTVLFDFAVALKCFGVALTYLIVIGDMMPDIAQGLNLEHWLFLNRRFWLLVSMALLVPLAFLRKMDSLKYTSFAGLLSVAYLVIIATWSYLKPEAFRPPVNAGMEAFASVSLAALKSFPVFVFSFTCHQNILPIQREAYDGSTRFMSKVINSCVYLSAGVYILFSLVSYANFGQIVQGNIFKNYPADAVEITIARILFAFLSAFSYPLQTLPCRMSIEHLIPLCRTTKKIHENKLHIAITSLVLLGTFSIAFVLDNLVLISGLIGTVAGIPICYILPFVFYYKLTEGRGWTRKRLAAAGLAVFGALAMIVSGVSLGITVLYPGLIFRESD